MLHPVRVAIPGCVEVVVGECVTATVESEVGRVLAYVASRLGAGPVVVEPCQELLDVMLGLANVKHRIVGCSPWFAPMASPYGRRQVVFDDTLRGAGSLWPARFFADKATQPLQRL